MPQTSALSQVVEELTEMQKKICSLDLEDLTYLLEEIKGLDVDWEIDYGYATKDYKKIQEDFFKWWTGLDMETRAGLASRMLPDSSFTKSL